MTVKELREACDFLITAGHGDKEVYSEGCDCIGPADDLVLDGNDALVTRS